jgi:ATP-dependent DNA helicase RecQ
MQPDDAVLSYPAAQNSHPATTAAIDALQTASSQLRFKPWGRQLLITSDNVPVCALSAKGLKKYNAYLNRSLSVERIVHLASFHRTPSEQDLAGNWIDPKKFPSWHVPLFQVIWEAEGGKR